MKAVLGGTIEVINDLLFKRAGSYDNLPRSRKLLWQIVRRVFPERDRWFFEGEIRIRGQLWADERKLIYEIVRAVNPRIVCEIGTWRGGGSTLFIAQALHDNGEGTLYTVEIDPCFYQQAMESYRRYRPDLLPHIEFHLGSSTDVYPPILKEKGMIDVLFLDGVGAEQSMAEFKVFVPWLRAGSVLIAHDWFDIKMSMLRPLLESDPSWRIEHLLLPPSSVGLAVLRKLDR